jgi:hypothetical protein
MNPVPGPAITSHLIGPLKKMIWEGLSEEAFSIRQTISSLIGWLKQPLVQV